MKTLSVKLPVPLAQWLSKRSRELGRTQSDLVREALERQKDGTGNQHARSCAERLTDLGGFFEGPPDLSTNSKYLKDLGT